MKLKKNLKSPWKQGISKFTNVIFKCIVKLVMVQGLKHCTQLNWFDPQHCKGVTLEYHS